MKTLVELYSTAPEKLGNYWYCPVCNKRYKKELSLSKHMNKMDCWKPYQIFKDEPEEQYIMDAYTNTLVLCGEDALILSRSIRNSSLYNKFCLVYLICQKHKIDMADYITFGYNTSKVRKSAYILKVLIDPETPSRYFKWRIHNITKDESVKHLLSFKDVYKEDRSKFLTNFLRGEFRLKDVSDILGMDYLLELPETAIVQILEASK